MTENSVWALLKGGPDSEVVADQNFTVHVPWSILSLQ